MDFAMNMEFWSDVGITVAARLSVVVLILWLTKRMIDARLGTQQATGTVAVAGTVNRMAESPIATTTGMPVAPEASPRNKQKANVLTLRRPNGEQSADRGDRERMRKQRLAYLEEHTTGRGH